MKDNVTFSYIKLILLLALVFIIGTIVTSQSALAISIDCEEKAFLTLINSYRQQNGLSPLAFSPTLTIAAQNHSKEMADNSYSSHTSLDGRSPIDRARSLGYSSSYVGECIYWGRSRAIDAFNGWKSSPGHNGLLLGSNYKVVGIGRAYNPNSTYGWYWTADLGDYDDSAGATFTQKCRYCYAWISGRVVDSNWQVIPNATIRVDNILVTFDARDGHFFAGMIPVGVHTVYYDAPGYRSQTQVIEIWHNQTTSTPTCLLSPAADNVGAVASTGEIFGRVVNQAGQMIPGTCIRIDATIMPTNPAGEFRFTLVHPGIYTIYYDAPGYKGQTQVVEVRAGQVMQSPTVIMSR